MFVSATPSHAERIVVPMDPWPPWKLVKEDWRVDEGIDSRLVEALLAAYNTQYGAALQAEYVGCPWKRCLEMMRGGEADLISGIFKRPEREDYLLFIDPPYKSKSSKVFYVPKGKKASIRQYEDLYGLKLGTQAGVKYFERFDNDAKLHKEETSDDVANFNKLEYGRIDAAISTETQADYLIAVHGFKGKFEKAAYQYDEDLPVYFAISKKSPLAERATRMSDIIARMKDDGIFEKIIQDFFANLPDRAGE
jgi:polar amino acid transport system substrate-binding protein